VTKVVKLSSEVREHKIEEVQSDIETEKDTNVAGKGQTEMWFYDKVW